METEGVVFLGLGGFEITRDTLGNDKFRGTQHLTQLLSKACQVFGFKLYRLSTLTVKVQIAIHIDVSARSKNKRGACLSSKFRVTRDELGKKRFEILEVVATVVTRLEIILLRPAFVGIDEFLELAHLLNSVTANWLSTNIKKRTL